MEKLSALGIKAAFLFAGCCLAPLNIAAQATPSAPQPDVLVLNDGEKLIGQIQPSTGANVSFKSNVVGVVTIPWTAVKELQSPQNFAVIPKSAKLRRRGGPGSIPVGPVAVQDGKVAVAPTGAAPASVPFADVSAVVTQADLQKAFASESFTQGWKGGATGGVSLTEATQKQQSFTGAVNLARSVPSAVWIDPASRTLMNFNSAYSNLSQPGTPTLKTSLVHFDLEQDWYLKPRLFAIATADLDHSFSQGLKLEQMYGAGLGYVFLKTSSQELDGRVSMDYINQRFENGTNNSLIGSQFGETYTRKFLHGILFDEALNFTPSWNETSAYSLIGTAALTFPVYHRLGFTIGTLENYINNPPPGFKKNSFQLTAGATYSLP